jgi:hypothetical protein
MINAQDVERMDFSFEYEGEKGGTVWGRLVCQWPEIYVRVYLGSSRDTGERFVLHMGKKHFGFMTSALRENEQSYYVSEEKLTVWRFDQVLVDVRVWDRKKRMPVFHAVRRVFENKEEQDLVLKMFEKAITGWVGFPSMYPQKTRFELTDNVLMKIKAGEYVRPQHSLNSFWTLNLLSKAVTSLMNYANLCLRR